VRQIFKYAVPLGGCTIAMPQDATLLHVDWQHGGVHLWALVDPNGYTVGRQFAIYGTGYSVDSNAEYVGTALDPAAPLVWHVFEIKP
jgi:hypothetical protein